MIEFVISFLIWMHFNIIDREMIKSCVQIIRLCAHGEILEISSLFS